MNLILSSTCTAACTTGTLTLGALTLCTIELPWLGNEADKSCVPAGDYELLAYISPKHGRTWRLHNPALDVWGYSSEPPWPMRTEVEIHSGNLASQSEACILIGMAAGQMLDPTTHQVEAAVLDSMIAFNKLRDAIELGEELTLTITRDGPYPA